jgi:signal transduction histidine kinase
MSSLALRRRLLEPPPRLRLPRRTARLRLTLLYGGLFLVCGAGLLAITYQLVHGGAKELPSAPSHDIRLIPSSHHPGAKLPGKVELSDQLLWSAVALAIMAVVSIGLGYYVAGRVLRPLRTITRTARAISARNLGERLALAGPNDEFKELGDTLDELLARLQAAFDSQRRFVANASHELRTPLTVERSLLQVALADPDPTIDSLLATCRNALLASEQQQHLIEGLLALASSESGIDPHEPVDLAELAAQALLSPLPDIDRLQLTIKTTLHPAPAAGDPRLLERLLGNLIENAARHNTSRGYIAITTATSNEHAIVTVANTGAVIPADQIERLFQPFQRLNGTRTNHTNGHGLGLSIVQAIAHAHHATLTTHPHPGGGLTIQVTFPKIPQAVGRHQPALLHKSRRRAGDDDESMAVGRY